MGNPGSSPFPKDMKKIVLITIVMVVIISCTTSDKGNVIAICSMGVKPDL